MEGRLTVLWEDKSVFPIDKFMQTAKLKRLGYTTYNEFQLKKVGVRMLEEFGDYHTVFWNCQMFVKCFLRVITGDEAEGECERSDVYSREDTMEIVDGETSKGDGPAHG